MYSVLHSPAVRVAQRYRTLHMFLRSVSQVTFTGFGELFNMRAVFDELLQIEQ
jgi:hypothetical protein